MATMYELKGQFLDLLMMADDPTLDPKIFQDSMEALKFEIKDKAEGYGAIIVQLESDSDGLKKEIDRLTARKRTIDNNIARLKANLQDAMEMTGETKIKTDRFSFGIQNNPASVVIDDVTAVPNMFLIPQEPKVDKAKIKDLLKKGEQFTFAHLENSKSLRIR